MNEQAVAKKELTQSERFLNKVITEFGSGVGEVALTQFQKRLAQNYFISLDSSLKMAEEKRLKKTNNQDPLPVIWQNVNMEKLARDVVSAARIGFDPAQPNHINMVPFKNNALGKYDIGFVPGYRGMELKATKYGLDVPNHVIIEIVYQNDKFKSFKRDRNNPYDTYTFEIVNDFDRGEIVGGFYYHVYLDKPEKNKLVVMTMKDIEKRKPAYASVEFWGGDKAIWKNNQKVGTEYTEGWREKMIEKTIYRAAYGAITIDSQKIDDDYMNLKQMEAELSEAEVEEEIHQNANGAVIDIQADPVQEADPSPTSQGGQSPDPVQAEETEFEPVGAGGGPGF